ncbi:hypothetical protein CIHG_07718 [Coccidioides immitis H538.4]|uniref:Uncharacterized protein n=3 Tax=Coccidioides immitis TaxID=5501 RepID=A0A0J8QUG7_COCIT|nr:hypothetical protein CIRG_04191 [Coccidioides immitis RMSCC 2394]KMU76086.1 hypothetical protein CISG_05345 [Coccidioides immitis RMSCC 3703]KMU90033.1 hypothetical protein CIHG_07718 [Coccidioides immitis H538.4]
MIFPKLFGTRTQGRSWWPNCRAGQFFLFPAVIFSVLLWIFVIASAIYSVVLDNKSPRALNAPIWWHRVSDDCTIAQGQIVALLFGICFETVQLSIHIFLFSTGRLHPITALVLSILSFGNWFGSSFYSPLANLAAERQFPATWETLFWIRQALGYCLLLLYLAYIVHASIATHRWRIAKKKRRTEEQETNIKLEDIE